MAQQSLYPGPPEQLRDLAAAARREGLSFAAFWDRAVLPKGPVITWTTPPERRPRGCVLWPSDSQDAKAWRIATFDVRTGWLRAYERMEPRAEETALRLLAPLLSATGLIPPAPTAEAERLTA